MLLCQANFWVLFAAAAALAGAVLTPEVGVSTRAGSCCCQLPNPSLASKRPPRRRAAAAAPAPGLFVPLLFWSPLYFVNSAGMKAGRNRRYRPCAVPADLHCQGTQIRLTLQFHFSRTCCQMCRWYTSRDAFSVNTFFMCDCAELSGARCLSAEHNPFICCSCGCHRGCCRSSSGMKHELNVPLKQCNRSHLMSLILSLFPCLAMPHLI